MVGLGRMGAGLSRQAVGRGHEVVGYNLDAAATEAVAKDGLEPAWSLGPRGSARATARPTPLRPPWRGDGGDLSGAQAAALTGDVLVDGGNSHWQDSERRHALFSEAGVRLLDMGTSGGLKGASEGACFMVGGEREGFELVAPLLRDLAVDEGGVVFAGRPGAGHFAKLVRNAIEFAMLQAIPEGVEMLGRCDYDLDVPSLLDNWMHGSVIRSWLVELMRDGLRAEPDLDELSTYVEDTAEVKWVLRWALERDIPTPVTGDAQTALMQYRDPDSVQAKAVALLRHGFGGHPVHRAGEQPARS